MSEFAPSSEVVGLIAGNRSLPVLAARAVKARGGQLAVAGLAGETDPAVYALADLKTEVPLGALGAMADFFVSSGVSKLAMVGGVSRDNIISRYNPDPDAVKLMESLETFQTDSILRAVAAYLESRGLRLVSVAELTPELLVPPGTLTSKAPEGDLMADLKLAFRLAKELGRLDCGQTVVVSDKIAVALEGADGTDATIRRGASLCLKPVAVAKVVKPSQDFRLDLPVIGPETIGALVEVKAGALALDAGGLIMLDPERCLSLAEAGNLAIVAWRDDEGRIGGSGRGSERVLNPAFEKGSGAGSESGSSRASENGFGVQSESDSSRASERGSGGGIHGDRQ